MPDVIDQPIHESLGRRLRQERERRHIALRSIADNTKISLPLLEDLERDDASKWPSGIFRRSFIRTYAAAIGVDADETAREFFERFPDPNDPDRVFAPAPAQPAEARPRAAVQLRLSDTGRAFARGLILRSARVRFAAIGCDAAVVLVIALALYAGVGEPWMPLCVALAGYYAGSILLLGNTPGVCLFASAGVSCSSFEEDRWIARDSPDASSSPLSAPQH